MRHSHITIVKRYEPVSLVLYAVATAVLGVELKLSGAEATEVVQQELSHLNLSVDSSEPLAKSQKIFVKDATSLKDLIRKFGPTFLVGKGTLDDEPVTIFHGQPFDLDQSMGEHSLNIISEPPDVRWINPKKSFPKPRPSWYRWADCLKDRTHGPNLSNTDHQNDGHGHQQDGHHQDGHHQDVYDHDEHEDLDRKRRLGHMSYSELVA